MQTAPPIERARAPYAGAVQPSRRKTAEVGIRVAIDMPDIGFEDVPIKPVMRAETVTNKNPKMTTKIEASRLENGPVGAPFTGIKVSMAHIMTNTPSEPAMVTFMLRSCSVRLVLATSAELWRRSFAPARSAPVMVGMERSR